MKSSYLTSTGAICCAIHQAREVKCLMLQLLKGVHHLHHQWILHRDLKTSNLLMSHRGILKIADFGLAREYGSPLKKYTKLVVRHILDCSREKRSS